MERGEAALEKRARGTRLRTGRYEQGGVKSLGSTEQSEHCQAWADISSSRKGTRRRSARWRRT
eukprot:10437193-Heterocapsa_arctica.AAC.1